MDFTEAYDIVAEQINNWIKIGIEAFPNVIIALIVIIFFYFISRLVRSVLTKIFNRLTTGNTPTIRLISKFGQFVVNSIGVFLALGALNLDKTLTSLLAGAGVMGLAFGFAFKETLSDYISGTLISVKQPYVPGEIIETNGYFAKVQSINLRATVLETFSGQMVVIPNSMIFAKPIINYTRLGKRRVEIEIGVSYNEDLKKVKTITLAVLAKHGFVLSDPPAQFFYRNFGASAIELELRYWVNYPGDIEFLEARSQSIEEIHQAFQENGIIIPFPIRTVHLNDLGRKS